MGQKSLIISFRKRQVSAVTFQLPRLLLPPEAKEGDIITLTVTVDSSGTKERRKNIERLMDGLFE